MKGQADEQYWDFFWLLIWSYIFVAYLILLFHIFGDVFRDRDLGGFAKALWVIFLIVAPFLSVLIYLIARGRGMAERQAGSGPAGSSRDGAVTSSLWLDTPNSADQIASAKALLDDGTINQGEYDD